MLWLDDEKNQILKMFKLKNIPFLRIFNL